MSEDRHAVLEERAEYNIKPLSPIARYFLEKGRSEELTEICNAAGVHEHDFERSVKWISWEQFETFLAKTREHLKSDDEFLDACSFRIVESYGNVIYLFGALTPALIYRTAPATSKYFSRVGRFELLDLASNFAKLRYISERRESRLMCLSRQAQSSKFPEIFNSPPAHLSEKKCIARGDDCCEYEFRWVNRLHWWLPVLGAFVGGVGGGFLQRNPLNAVEGALLGGLIGYVLEQRKTVDSNNRSNDEIREVARATVQAEADARSELLELHERQKGWARVIEEQYVDREAILQKVAGELDALRSARDSTILGVSHDLRNPLNVLTLTLEEIKNPKTPAAQRAEAIGDLESAISQMNGLLAQLMTQILNSKLELSPKQLPVAPMRDKLHRRLSALVYGGNIKASVLETREAPREIEIDPLVFDRVTDNILGNAAKYTVRGSIVVEIDGVPDYLVIKVSDTGRGIADEEMEKVFSVEGSDPKRRAQNSYGVGLSVVVDLLRRVGGRIEVMSRLGVGTTFWIYFPIVAKTSPSGRPLSPSHLPQTKADSKQDISSTNVVRIRRNAG